MKKIYSKPESRIIYIETTHILCSSGVPPTSEEPDEYYDLFN